MSVLSELNHPIDFAAVVPSEIVPSITSLIEDVNGRLSQIEGEVASRTWANTMNALDESTKDLEEVFGLVRHLEGVVSTPELREASASILGSVTDLFSSIPLRSGLWQALEQYAGTPDAATLTGTRRRFLEKTLKDFKRQGAGLTPEDKQALIKVRNALSEKTNTFKQNVLDSQNSFELLIEDESELEGLPDSIKSMTKQMAQQLGLGGYRLTLQMPVLLPVLKYVKSERVRKAMFLAKAEIASHGATSNRDLIDEILSLRREEARILGFKSFSDLVTEDRMAGSGARVGEFLEDLTSKVMPYAEQEHRQLLEFYREQCEHPSATLQAWDIAFWSERLREARYDFDEEVLRPYFSVPVVMKGMFEITSKLFGITIREADYPGWHNTVSSYEILSDAGEVLCYFYVDLYPRETKREGAWMGNLITGGPLESGTKPHVAFFCGNFTPPIGSAAGLLTHTEVRTVFHEFGHLLHQALSDVEVRSLSGTNVAWDFVELPSQILENWTWESEGLAYIAKHFETGAALPDELLERLLQARSFREASATLRQLVFAITDYELHSEHSPRTGESAVAFARRKLQELSFVPISEDYPWLCSFSHLFADPVAYASGYYSYKWAEVLDADAFTRFKQEGVMNGQTGRAFRADILARGNSEDPSVLFRNFMGRDPNGDALLMRAGLA